MNTEEHKSRHVLLHQSLDELLADWIANSGEERPYPSEHTISDLIEWSYQQTKNPTPSNAVRTAECWKHERLYDLVRYCRSELHQAKLITDDEYAQLVETGSESARRLERYDDVRHQLQQQALPQTPAVNAAGVAYPSTKEQEAHWEEKDREFQLGMTDHGGNVIEDRREANAEQYGD